MSGTRLYVGGISSRSRPEDLEHAFGKYGKVMRVDMKNGFAFLEFNDSRDADDAVRGMDGRDFDGRRLQVEAARGPKRGGGSGVGGRSRGGYRVTVEGLASRTSWQDLKDFARVAGSVAFTDVYVERGKKTGVIEYSSYDDMQEALRKLDDTKLDDVYVRLYPEKGSEGDRGSSGGSGGGGSSRSNGDRGRSPARRSPPRARSRSPRRTEERKDDRARSRSPRRASSRDRAPPARAKSRSPVRREDDKRDDRDDRSRDAPKKEEPAAVSPRRD